MKIADAIKSSIISKRGFKGSYVVDEAGLPLDKEWTKDFYADVYEITKENKVIIYEVKSCLSDYRSDKKWHNYLDFCDLFYFVSTKDVIEVIKNEVPSHVGLYVFDKGHIICARASKKHKDNTYTDVLKEKILRVISYRYINENARNIKRYRKEIKLPRSIKAKP